MYDPKDDKGKGYDKDHGHDRDHDRDQSLSDDYRDMGEPEAADFVGDDD